MRVDWNGHLPDLQALRAAKEAEATISSLPPVAALDAYYVDHRGHTFHVREGTYVYEGRSSSSAAG